MFLSEIAVSLLVRLWVEIMPGQGGWTACAVSLLVRLWVEMLHVLRRDFQLPSASLWGCELKCFLRMGKQRLGQCQPPCEAVSWNTITGSKTMPTVGQPPCEAVSWNGIEIPEDKQADVSASLWGCELKFLLIVTTDFRYSSASLWGCELKCFQHDP